MNTTREISLRSAARRPAYLSAQVWPAALVSSLLTRRRVSRTKTPMPRRRKAAEGNGSKGTSEAPSLPLEARDLSTADPYDLVSGVIVRPERSRTRQRSRRPSGSPPGRELDPAEQDKFRTKTRRRVDGAGAAAVDAGPVRQRLSRRTISPVHNAERISPVPNAERGPLEGPLDADGRHPSLRKLSQVVLHGDEQSGTSKTSQSVP
eukprot:scaffold52691_cov27-Phaeocystis_antarctica.AAC.1